MLERLQKYMARCEIGSRRKCEEIITSGRVRVNSEIVSELGTKIDPEVDLVYLDEVLIKPQENMVYIALNKPTGYISSVKDEKGRQTIIDLVKVPERLFPVGRLDYDSSGLILLTNDGEVYNHIIHPRNEIDKIYEALVSGTPTEEEINAFCNGLDIGDFITSKANMHIIKTSGSKSLLQIIIHEGKNKQVRRMCTAINHEVLELTRVRVGNISLEGIPSGDWRYLSESEVNYLKNL